MSYYEATRLGADEIASTTIGEVEQLDLEPGLEARVADPLWMLARQWQLGEFTGEDAASPVRVDATSEHTTITQAGPWAPGRANPMLPVPADLPLEPLIEREVVTLGPAQFGHAVEAGLHLLRLLDAHGVGHLRDTLREQFPLPRPPAARVDARDTRLVEMSRRRSLNGFLARLALRRVGISAAASAPGVPAADRGTVEVVLKEWRDWYDSRFSEPSLVEGVIDFVADGEVDPAPYFTDRRLSYGVQVAAPTPDPQVPRAGVQLRATSYHGGRLDWDDFDLTGDAVLLEPTERLATQDHTLLPTPVRFPGMPAQRFWELEGWTVDLGGVQAGPHEPARMLMAEFGLVFGDDWFRLPLRVPVGSLVRLTDLRVTDTFGDVTMIRPAGALDHERLGARPWVWTEQTGDPGGTTDVGPWLFLPPVLAGSYESAPVEDVQLARDEMANLAWAIERTVESPTGRPRNRQDRWRDRRHEVWVAAGIVDDPTVPEGADPAEDMWTYRAEGVSPSHWIPLAAVPVDGGPATELRRGRMAQWATGVDPEAGAQSRLLAPWLARMAFNEEEVPREGTRVSRMWQLARTADGGVRLWMSRRRRTGAGERDSGLRHDRMIRRRG